MKKVVFLISLLAFFVSLKASFAQANYTALDQRYGFRDAKFEMPVSAIKGLVLSTKDGKNVRTYVRPTDKMSVGQAKLTKIVYQSYKGQIHMVAYYCDESNASALLYALEQAYGQGLANIPGEVSWHGKRVHMDYFAFDTEKGYAWVCLSSRKLDDKVEAEEKQAVRGDL